MATAGPNYAGTGANFNDGGNIAWTNPANIQGDVTADAATVSPAANGNTSQRLRASNYSFSIPAGSTINGITVEVEQQAANASRHAWSSVQLLIGGTESGSNLSDGSAIPTTKGFKTFGGATNLWGLTPTQAQVVASGFGVSLKVVRNSSQSTTTSLFRARITVNYTPISGASSLAGSGVVSATARTVTLGAGALAGSGDLAGSGTRITSGAAALAGSGALSGTGARSAASGSALAGSGALSGGAGILARQGASSLAGSGALVADGIVPGGWGAPENLQAVAISTSEIDLTWDAVPGAVAYDVERNGVVIASDVATNSYSDTSLASSTSYTYRVRAVGA